MSAKTLTTARQDLPSRPVLARRRLLAATFLAVAIVAVVLASVAVGTAQIPPATVWNALTHYDPTNSEHIAVVDKRLPRTVVGLTVGAALGLAGALAQGVTRNPLADPGILGLSQGAALSVVISITVFGATGPAQYVWFACAGAAIAGAFVWIIASRGRDGATPVKLALSGAAISAALASLVSAALLLQREALDTMRFWQVGALAGRGFDVLAPVLPLLVVAVAVAVMSGRFLNLFALGDDTAAGLGLSVGRARLGIGALIVILAGCATAVAGPLAFVGLVVPHMVRAISGADYRWILAYSAPTAAVFVVAADVLARIVARPSEVQVGIVVAAIGAPFFIALVRRGRTVGL